MQNVKYVHEPFFAMISASKLMLTLVLLSTALTSVTTVLAQNQWTRYGSTPILSTPSWASGEVRPRVVYDGKTFRMWFMGQNSTGYVDGLGIGYATSTDGLKWVVNPQPVLTDRINPEKWTAYGSVYQITQVRIGSVVWTGSQFMMWYAGWNSTGYGVAIALATSPDGVTWTRYSRNPVMTESSIDWDGMYQPYVIQVGSSFKMWYVCSNANIPSGESGEAICYATSNDGMSWVKGSSPVLQAREISAWEAGFLYSPTVIYDGSVYGMWYSGCNSTSSSALCQIGYATSKDGITWTRDPNNPILSLGPSGAWDAGGVENQCVVQYNGGFLLYYDGYATTTSSLAFIGLARSPPNFVLPESPSPLPMIGGAMLIMLTGLSLKKRRLTRQQ